MRGVGGIPYHRPFDHPDAHRRADTVTPAVGAALTPCPILCGRPPAATAFDGRRRRRAAHHRDGAGRL